MMKGFICALLMAPIIGVATEDAAPPKSGVVDRSRAPVSEFDIHSAERFAKLALACVGKEYPNKISHVLNSDTDVAPPRGCWRESPRRFLPTICDGTRFPPRLKSISAPDSQQSQARTT